MHGARISEAHELWLFVRNWLQSPEEPCNPTDDIKADTVVAHANKSTARSEVAHLLYDLPEWKGTNRPMSHMCVYLQSYPDSSEPRSFKENTRGVFYTIV